MHPLYKSRHTEELWILFDCHLWETRNRLSRERRAWGLCATIENLGHGYAILVLRPGGARRSAA